MVQRIQPAPGQESVWDYPRPPRLEQTTKRLRVVFADVLIADTQRGYRILETSHPPAYYIPQSDIQMQYLSLVSQTSYCEFKGQASYWSLRVGERSVAAVGWMYAQPSAAYSAIRDHIAFYASRVDACYVDDEQVNPQAGDFYGGWITSDIVGPFKGGAGTWGW